MRVPVAPLLVVVGCVAPPAAAQRPAPTAPPPDPERYVHTIVPRDTLIAVSRKLLADPRGWRLLQRLNKVRNPRQLRPGSTLDIPVDLLRSVPATAEVLWVRGGGARVARPDGTQAVALVGATVGQGARITTGDGDAIGLRLSTGAIRREGITNPGFETRIGPGRYTWRVRSRATRPDGQPDLGPWNDALTFTLKAVPPAGPAATADAASKTVLALRWAVGLTGDRYRVQLARDAAFAAPLVETTVGEPTLSVPRPAPGSYAVRIAIVNAEGTEGPFGPVQTFEVAKIRTRSWWWILEPAAVIAAGVIAAL